MVLGELIGRGVVFVSTWASECVCVYLCDSVCVCTEIKSERDGQQLHRKSTYEWGGGGVQGAYCGHSVPEKRVEGREELTCTSQNVFVV